MILKELRVMRGPNMWSDEHHNIIALNLSYEGFDEKKIQHTFEKFAGVLFPEEQIPAPVTALDLTALVARAAIAIQPEMKPVFHDAKLKGTDSYYAVFSYELEEVGVEAANKITGIILELSANPDKHINIKSIKQELLNLNRVLDLGPTTKAIVDAAKKR